jgi:hypothetical protein
MNNTADKQQHDSTPKQQTKCALFNLPGELRNYIYTLTLKPNTPIVNPTWELGTTEPKHYKLPLLGTALLRTCRAIYLESNQALMLQNSEFVFTRVQHIQAFFARLTLAQAKQITRITIDLREASCTASAAAVDSTTEEIQVANEWTHYFCCIQGAHMMGAWCSNLSTLQSDLPHLRSLCLDLTNWQSPHAADRPSGWKYLKSLLCKTHGLESLTLKGKCLDSSFWYNKPVPWSLGVWFSPVFDRDEAALMDLIGGVVRKACDDEIKVLEWHVTDGTTTLTVGVEDAPKASTLVGVELPRLSQRGRMSWTAFLDFKDDQTESSRKRKDSMFASSTVWQGAHEVEV